MIYIFIHKFIDKRMNEWNDLSHAINIKKNNQSHEKMFSTRKVLIYSKGATIKKTGIFA